MRKLQNGIDNSEETKQLAAYHQSLNDDTAQLKQQDTAPNNTGIPDPMKTSMEQQSGVSLNDVKVHRNSDKPAQLNAHAYAQGKEVHLAPGQEKHLPNELGHVVQQKKGNVKPTKVENGAQINDDPTLEKDADTSASKSLNGKNDTTQLKSKESNTDVVQKSQVGIGPVPGQQYVLPDKRYEVELTEDEAEQDTEFSAGPITYSNGVITFSLRGQEVTIDTKGETALSGSLPSQMIELNSLPNVNLSVDIPFAPGVYATAGLSVSPSMSLELSGGSYTPSKGEQTTMSLDGAGITGSMGLEITVSGGVGAGLANVGGIEAGLSASIGAFASLSGSMGGLVNFSEGSYEMGTSLGAEADVTGKAGAYVAAKFLGLRAQKNLNIGEKTFAHFSYSRGATLSGSSQDKTLLNPTLEDFSILEYSTLNGETYASTDEGDFTSFSEDEKRFILKGGAEPSKTAAV